MTLRMATAQNIVVNELLCFLSNKVRSMTYDSLMKLCMDFYDEEAVISAKALLLEHVVIPDNDDNRKKRIGENKKATSMKDILNVFLELTLEDVPLFVANNLHNLPPLSMDNFDMSRLMRDMESIKLQMKVLQEAQETSLSAHVAICREKSRDTVVDASPAHSTGTPPSPVGVRTTLGSPPTAHATEESESREIPTYNPHIDDNDGDVEDIRRLAMIQGRFAFTSPPQSRGRNMNNDRNRNRHHGDIQTTGAATGHVWRGRLDSHPRGNPNPNRQQNINHQDNTNRVNHPRGGHSQHRQARVENAVITGTSNNCSLSAAPPRNGLRQSRRDGLFISRLSRNTRAINVLNYIRNEANLNIRCDPIATRYDTYRSYYIHAAPQHHALIKKYNPK